MQVVGLKERATRRARGAWQEQFEREGETVDWAKRGGSCDSN